jgi:hypothetical protein
LRLRGEREKWRMGGIIRKIYKDKSKKIKVIKKLPSLEGQGVGIRSSQNT